MNDPNACFVIGRLTKDPDLKYTADQKPIVKFGLANNKKFGQTEKTNFFNVTCFGNTANFVATYLKKGAKVCVQGEMEYSSWTDQQTGIKNSAISIIGTSITGLDPAPQNAGQQQPAPQQFKDPWDPANQPQQYPHPNAHGGQPPQSASAYGQPPAYNKAPAPGMAPVPNPWG
jgi:single-strand DNA-binding protein